MEDPEWSAVQALIESLDGVERDTVELQTEDAILIISSSRGDERYVAEFLSGNSSHHAVDAGSSSEGPWVPIVAGGQMTETPRRDTIDRVDTLAIAHHFFKAGSMHPQKAWEAEAYE
ncbi:hypothetical protein HY251_09860 [bacterium]|nr:hypothetical protein [bacterium]